MDVPNQKLLAFRELLRRLAASVLCTVNILRFPVISWLALHYQHAQTPDPAFLCVCAFVLSSFPYCTHYVCPWRHSRIWREKICLSWVQIIEFLEQPRKNLLDALLKNGTHKLIRTQEVCIHLSLMFKWFIGWTLKFVPGSSNYFLDIVTILCQGK